MSRDIKFRVYDQKTGTPQVVMLSTVEVGSKYGCFNGLPDNLAVCQYTGLKDRHGKEIFEGDIVKRYGGGLLGDPSEVLFIGEVTFTQNGWKAKYNKMKGTVNPLSETAYGNIFNQDELMVVGNIYENDIDSIPEGLLE